jgi:hypothetical protein
MNHKLLTIASMLVAVVAFSAIPGFSSSTYHIRANVPFSFIVGTTRLPAGEYEISMPNSNDTLMIREVNGHTSVLVRTMTATPSYGVAQKTELVFDKVGQDAFLRQVWERRLPNGDKFSESKREHQDLAWYHQSNPNTEVVPAKTVTG